MVISLRHSYWFPLLATLAVPLAAQQTFTTKTVFDIGGTMDNPADELWRISSAYRTAKGEFVVAINKPVEVRVYDAAGKFLRRLGRAGAGPGEFKSGASVRPWTGDSILTLSTGARRWILYALNGSLMREWPADSTHPIPAGTVLRNWAFTPTTIVGSAGCSQTTINSLPVPSPWELREVVTDPAGRVWVRNTDVLWQIYSPNGSRLGTVTLPSRLTVYQFSGNLVIGQRFDEDDAEHVVAIQVGLPQAPAGSALCAPAAITAPGAANLRIDLGNLRTAGEVVRADTKKYPTTVPTTLVVIPETVEVDFLSSTADSWVVRIKPKDKSMTLHCAFSFGPHGIPGWVNGDVACSN